MAIGVAILGNFIIKIDCCPLTLCGGGGVGGGASGVCSILFDLDREALCCGGEGGATAEKLSWKIIVMKYEADLGKQIAQKGRV